MEFEKLAPVVEILKRIVASGYVKNSYPISAICIAPVGAGKTTVLKKIVGDGIMGLSDVTPFGLTKLLPEIRAKSIKHLVIFDLVEPMSRNRAVVNSFIGFMNSLIEEGVFKISTGFIEIKEPIQLGLITSTTQVEFSDKRRGWLGIGFVSRLLPITFNYTATDVIQIMEQIAKSEIPQIKAITLKRKSKEIKINERIFNKLIPYAQSIDISGEKPLPFRRLNQLKILLMANALLRNDDKVTDEDFEWFKKYSKWINFEFNHL